MMAASPTESHFQILNMRGSAQSHSTGTVHSPGMSALAAANKHRILEVILVQQQGGAGAGAGAGEKNYCDNCCCYYYNYYCCTC